MRDVVVYTSDHCGYCTRVKMLLRSRGIEFREENLSGDRDAIVELVARTGMTTLPQVMIDGVLVGGYQETAAAAKSGLLDDLLAA